MCSIAGFISPNLSRSHIQRMNRSMSHRGPDAHGIFYNEAQQVALAHNRLSILDLSEKANQPFYSSCGRYVLVFNGEVYNYADLRNKIEVFRQEKATLNALRQQGDVLTTEASFSTGSDTEVLAEGFSLWGMRMAEKLNGMFALAIYDQQDKVLYLMRDRMGIKPLYYYHQENKFAFASELKGITQLFQDEVLPLNKKAIYSFLNMGYMPNGQTIYENVHAFPAGHIGVFKEDKFNIVPYWQAVEKIEANVLSDEVNAKKSLKTLIEKSIEKRLISDVPLGTFLSGGTDSSLVTAIASNMHSGTLKSFSIGFKENKYNESEHAKRVAEKLGTDHHEFILTQDDALEKIADLSSIFDQPFVDSSAIPTLLVSHYARKHVTVALSGDGGDELFLGYGMYQWAKRMHKPLLKLGRPIIKNILQWHPSHRYKKASSFFQRYTNLQQHIFSQEQGLFGEFEIEKLLKKEFFEKEVIKETQDFTRGLSCEETQAFFDLTHYLKDDLLVKVDRASMYEGLEVRVPLLDHRIVEFALNVDPKLKIHKGTTKYLLKQVLYDYLPQSLMERPKWGFSIPLEKWLGKELRPLIEQYLEESLIEAAGIVNPVEVKKLIEKFDKGHAYLYNRIWSLILLHKWLYENGRISHQPN